jgi:undecaprenyl-diphosphatase
MPSAQDTLAPAARPVAGRVTNPIERRRCLHCEPPLTPAGFFAGRRPLLVGLAVLFVVLAVSAFVDGGALLLRWDEPIQRAVESHRESVADAVFRRISFLGSTRVVFGLGALLAVAAWRRCRAVGVVVVVAMLLRPLVEFVVKAVVGRDRPDLDRLVPGNGPSFPSGHVLAAVALWGLVPLVMTLYTRRRAVWWVAVWTSMALIVAIGASRTYLGVHWFTDVLGGMILGTFFLLGAERLHRWEHERRPCTHRCSGPSASPPTDP